LEVSCSNEKVDFGQFFFEDLPVPLGKASRDNKEATSALLLIMGELKDRLDRLLRRILDKGAGVNDEDLGGRRIRGERVFLSGEETEDHFGVDEVFGTSEADKTDRFFH